MHIPDVHDYSPDPVHVVQEFLSSRTLDRVKEAVGCIIEEQYSHLTSYADEYISQLAASRAENFIEKVLSGDEDAGRALFQDETGYSRYRMADKTPWSQVIRGVLFESRAMELRRRIVEAHSDLISNERIKDLESTVEGLRLQIVELQRRLTRHDD